MTEKEKMLEFLTLRHRGYSALDASQFVGFDVDITGHWHRSDMFRKVLKEFRAQQEVPDSEYGSLLEMGFTLMRAAYT